jgi:AAA ATPase domain
VTTRDIESGVGREREVAALTAFLDSVLSGPSALLIEGEPGIGKTTLWRDAVRQARDRGYRVLQARPAESEARLSFAALADIAGAACDEAGARLPAPQEHALAVALLRKSADGPADARTTGTALVWDFAHSGEVPNRPDDSLKIVVSPGSGA